MIPSQHQRRAHLLLRGLDVKEWRAPPRGRLFCGVALGRQKAVRLRVGLTLLEAHVGHSKKRATATNANILFSFHCGTTLRHAERAINNSE